MDIHTTIFERRLVKRKRENQLIERVLNDLSPRPVRESLAITRYDPRHSNHWYFGVSGFQWTYILGASVPYLFVLDDWWWAFVALVFWWAIGWLVWFKLR